MTTRNRDNQDVLIDEPAANLIEPAVASKRLVLPAGEPTGQLKQPKLSQTSSKPETSEVTVAPNLSDVVTGKVEAAAEDESTFRRSQRLNEVVHHVLTFGLALSTVLILLGLGLDLANHRQVPTDVPGFREAFRRTAELRPSGFLTLGLLVLVATPILRVIGSTLAFLYERDWRYAAITFFVLLVVSLSLLLGQG